MQAISLALFSILIRFTISQVIETATEITLQRIEQISGFGMLKANLRVTKFNRTCAVLNGTVDIFVDLDNSYSFQMKAAYSRMGNNQFNEYPMKIAERPMCHYINDTYRIFQDMLHDTTNLPLVGPEGLCPMPAGNYWFKQVKNIMNDVPPMVPEGYWRLSFLISGRQDIAELQVFVSLTKGFFG
ncbi:uncharacterized protein LOC134218825 [Armigeres subalbatus]|uniref:uncharacterized protein LOC134218825 n=1 Tax=Armigeres subalbatus TaxID=124917 RepID=UPI002ED4E273